MLFSEWCVGEVYIMELYTSGYVYDSYKQMQSYAVSHTKITGDNKKVLELKQTFLCNHKAGGVWRVSSPSGYIKMQNVTTDKSFIQRDQIAANPWFA